MSFLKNFFALSAPKFKIEGTYDHSQCAFTNVIDANMVELSLKLPMGWCKFNVLIKGLYITNKNLIPTYNYALFLNHILKDRDINVIIGKVVNKHVVLEGSIYMFDYNTEERINLRNYLTTVYTPYLIPAKPVFKKSKKIKKVFQAMRLDESSVEITTDSDPILNMQDSVDLKAVSVESVEPKDVKPVEPVVPTDVKQVKPTDVKPVEPVVPTDVKQVKPTDVTPVEPVDVKQVKPTGVKQVEKVKPTSVTIEPMTPTDAVSVKPVSNLTNSIMDLKKYSHVEPECSVSDTDSEWDMIMELP